MLTNLVLPLTVLIAATMGMCLINAMRQQRTRDQLKIATRGLYGEGRVVAIQRPFLFDPCTRLYFDFAPPGATEPLRCCHVARYSNDQIAELPCEGTRVTVRYLPNEPQRAVISKLVAF